MANEVNPLAVRAPQRDHVRGGAQSPELGAAPQNQFVLQRK
ncbi:hypothetical protein ACPCIR_26550 [Mycobacterium sp. NPDC051198]